MASDDGRPSPKRIKRSNRKTTTNVEIQRGRQRERKREGEIEREIQNQIRKYV